jgi:cytochrome d ubiquinol oxidase subunit I
MIALEVLTSFFLEAGFLGIMLFGLRRVGPKLHFLATCMVALGTLMSASWILSANSWMQTPDGVAMRDGRLVVTDWWKVVVNPSWLYRLPHMVTAAYLTASFLVAGVGVWYLLRGKHTVFARKSVSLGMSFAAILDRWPGFYRRHSLWHDAEASAVQDASGRRLLGSSPHRPRPITG